MTTETKTIDATPTWESMVPVLMYIIRNIDRMDALNDIEQELRVMASAADKWNAYAKAQTELVS